MRKKLNYYYRVFETLDYRKCSISFIMLRVFPLMFMIFSLKVYPHSNSNNLKSAAVIWGAKQTPISGSVKDASGTPIPGVNILLVGTVTGTQTDYI